MELGRNVVIMRVGVKIMHQSNARRPLNDRVKKKTMLFFKIVLMIFSEITGINLNFLKTKKKTFFQKL